MSEIFSRLNPGNSQPHVTPARELEAAAIRLASEDSREKFTQLPLAERDRSHIATIVRERLGLHHIQGALTAEVTKTGKPVTVLRPVESMSGVPTSRSTPGVVITTASKLEDVLSQRIPLSDLRAGRYDLIATSALPSDREAMVSAYESYVPSDNARAHQWRPEDGEVAYVRAQKHDPSTESSTVPGMFFGSQDGVDIFAGALNIKDGTYREVQLTQPLAPLPPGMIAKE